MWLREPLGLFVTGTDTEIGKTFAACALLRAFRNAGMNAAPMKPIAAGTMSRNGGELNEDVHELLAAYREAGATLDESIVNPYCFRDAIAPHIAAQRESRAVDLAVIERAFSALKSTHDVVIVEGAGGFLVPLDDRDTLAVLPQRLSLDVVLVVGMRLGCINHALLTAEAIRSRGLKLCGWIANSPQPTMTAYDENLATLRARLNAPLIGEIGYGAAVGEAAHALNVSALVAAKY